MSCDTFIFDFPLFRHDDFLNGEKEITFGYGAGVVTNYVSIMIQKYSECNKANPRDLTAATGLVILLILDSNRRFFKPCDLEI